MKKFKFSSGEITFSSLPTKLEREIYSLIREKDGKFSLDELTNKLEISAEKLYSSLERFQKKIISYKGEDRLVSGSIISGFTVDSGILTIFINSSMIDSLNSSFKEFDTILSLTDETAIRFFLEVCRNTSTVYETTVTIDEIKDILCNTSYERFFDFERHVLKKLKKEIDESTPYILSYEKLKDGVHKNSKINRLKILVTRKNYFENSADAIELLENTSSYSDKNTALLSIIELLEKFSKEEVDSAILLLKNGDTIENNLKERALEVRESSRSFRLIFSTRERFSNILKLQNRIFKEIKKIETSEFLYDEFVTTNILKNLYQLSIKKELHFEKNRIKLQIRSFPHKEYEVKIFSR